MAETKLTDLLLRWRGAGFVVPTIKICRNSEAGASSSLANELEDLLVTDEWLASPVLGNFREQTMFNGIPFRGASRIMRDGNGETELIAELFLNLSLPDIIPARITATRISEDEQFGGVGIPRDSFSKPPACDRAGSKVGSIMGYTHEDGASIGQQIVNPVGDGDPNRISTKIVVVDQQRRTAPAHPVRSKNSIPLDIIGREFPRSPGVRFFMQTGLDPFRFVIIAVAGWMNQHQQHAIDYLLEENRVLRELIGSRPIRFSDDQRCRLAAKAKKLGRKLLAEIAKIVTPETLMAWHRKLIAKKYDGSAHRMPGRPRIATGIEALVIRMAEETETGATAASRVHSPIWDTCWHMARSRNILKHHGIEPAPERSRKTTWKEFLSRHWGQIVASDFFTVEVWTRAGLQRFVVLFFIELSTRRVEVGGITRVANGLWMTQIARNLTDAVDGFFIGKRYLIHDRDPLYTRDFLNMLAEAGVQSVKLPPRSPNLNAYAERFVRTIKESCLERMIFFGETSLRKAIAEFVAHYHLERNHQGLGNRLIVPIEATGETAETVQRRQRLGGMLNYYYREAA